MKYALRLSATVLIAFWGIAICQDTLPTGAEIVDRMMEVMTPENSKATMSQTIITSSGKTRTFEFESYSAVRGEKNLMIYNHPSAVRGQSFLMLNHADDIWTYFPRTNRVRKLASHAKKQKVQGSDFTYEDMGSGDSWSREYQSSNLGETELNNEACWKLESIAIPEEDPAYVKVIIWVRQSDYYPLQMDYFETESRMLKTLNFENIEIIDGYPTAMQMIMTNHVNLTETSMEIKTITYKWDPPRDYFSERNLKK
ncbi:outer membrane lipoprotein-sorting protein [Candidatus Neomarinimicrobiota bacterium]